jgi:hypothetical protein
MRKRLLAPWMLSSFVLLLAGECQFFGAFGSCGAFLVIRVSATESQSYSRIANPTVTARLVDQPSSAPAISRHASDSTLTEIRGSGGTYDVSVAKAGFASVTRRVVVQDRGACVSPRAVDLDVVMARSPN